MIFADKILESAQEGIVLLKNSDNALPLKSDECVCVFGRTQFDYYRSGTGSGGSVHIPYTTNLTDELIALHEKENTADINAKLCQIYRQWINDNPFDDGEGKWAAEPNSQKDMSIPQSLAEECARNSSKAIYVIGRNSGEDKDITKEKGSFFLTDIEKGNLSVLCKTFKDVIVVFNTSGIIDMSWTTESDFATGIKALVYAWEGGQEGGRACARVLAGKAVPSGKLSDTIAKTLDDYPSTPNFGSTGDVIYQEDIYVGYRYFVTFAKDKILYPFGYGLSYTSFKLTSAMASSEGLSVSADVTVKNTGNIYSGKEVVQIYVSAPQGKLGKSARILAAFKKTNVIEPEKEETLHISFNLESIASYDESGATGNKSCFVLEEGDYGIYAGTDSCSATLIHTVHLDKTIVTQKLEQCCAPTREFKVLKPGVQNIDGSFAKEYQNAYLNATDMSKRIKDRLPKEISFTGNKGITFDMLKKDPSQMDSFVAQLTDAELSTMVRGEGMLSQKVTPGIAAAYGGVSESLHSYGIPCAGCSDGPSGIRMDTGTEASLMPIGTLLACTWNPKLVKELYVFEGKELAQNKIDALLGPGMNIHRNPLGGRNFEYFSEDPLLTGTMAVAEIEGLREGGSNATIKHFATNNQETNRHRGNSILTERALREIYLKGFEMAVKEGKACSVMTTYNALNGHWTASNYDLVNVILHSEWGFKGLVMTDWWAKMNDCVKGGEPSVKNAASMVRARNNVYMVVDNDGAETNIFKDDIEQSLKDGNLTRAELQLSVKDILGFLLNAPVAKRPLRALKEEVFFTATISEPPAGSNTANEDDFFTCNAGECVYFNATKDALYNIMGVYCKKEDNLSQSACILKIDGQPAASFECRSTFGKDVFIQGTKIHLSKGYYKIELVHTKPGITVKSIGFTSKIMTPITAGWEF